MPEGVLRLKTRAEFLRVAAAGRKWAAPGLVLQAAARQGHEEDSPMRVGFTATKKTGNAVARNRIKRRLRAVAAEILPIHGKSGWDYVLIGRKNTLQRPYEKLKQDLQIALAKTKTKPASEAKVSQKNAG